MAKAAVIRDLTQGPIVKHLLGAAVIFSAIEAGLNGLLVRWQMNKWLAGFSR